MGLFDNILKDGESLIKMEEALDFEFLPKSLPFREKEQKFIAEIIKPLFQSRNGRNVVMHGPPGIGKTAAARHVVRELEEETADIYPIYINCWQNNTTYKIMIEMCEQLGYRLVQNKKTVDLCKVVASMVNKKSAVFIFDEIDKAEEYDFLYFILEEIYKKSIVLITNFKEWIATLDSRIKSRLLPELLEFKQYTEHETKEIMKIRAGYAFPEGVWYDPAFTRIAKKTFEVKDIRTGLFLMREAALIAEGQSKKNVELIDVEKAIAKLDDFSIKSSTDLEEDSKFILSIVKEHSGKKIGDLYDIYQKKGGKHTYKTFQRKISDLDKNQFISTKKQKGTGGNTTIVEKKLTDY
ncbi:MAG: AAA family ATPase [Nanoarchaeota archaeon]|nr:AAA family ATPase [Nanoarchaeota archaeon]MBU1321797.1 AAA family ATPase [Nanoarchaeota archaeon]MBU1597325.1 AAA family ATPase [Nanoarchaeota archaeon]MBU2441402.1 AAA family ATPase [Nanoarchaeota archaeon]